MKISSVKKPTFAPLVSTADRMKIFGSFEYTVNADRTIKFKGDWARKNIIQVEIPQLVGIEGAPASGKVWVHRLVAEQIKGFFEAVEHEGLLDLILTWGGSFNPRLVRGGSTLSNHAFGTAFDINVVWNPLGKEPAARGAKGSVIELVAIAHQFGFYWGGLFSRKDGMHFEVAVVGMSPSGHALAEPIAVDRPSTDISPDDATDDLQPAIALSPGQTNLVETQQPPQPVVGGGPDDPPQQASTGGTKSLWTTISTQAAALATGLWAVIQNNQQLIKWVLIIGGGLAAVYLLRQTIMDIFRIRVAADPNKINSR